LSCGCFRTKTIWEVVESILKDNFLESWCGSFYKPKGMKKWKQQFDVEKLLNSYYDRWIRLIIIGKIFFYGKLSSLSNSFERKTKNNDPPGKLKKVVKSNAWSIKTKSVGHKSPLTYLSILMACKSYQNVSVTIKARAHRMFNSNFGSMYEQS
jgi:hypothetical protein